MEKRIITAIGDETLNNILRQKENLIIESTDIQYQEGIIEALEKYPDTDIVILNDEIMGDLEIEELILSITILKNDIEIIVITNKKEEIEANKNVIKIIDHKPNYEDDILEYLLENTDVNKKQEEQNFNENQKDIIMCIGKSGIRKDKFHSNTFETY